MRQPVAHIATLFFMLLWIQCGQALSQESDQQRPEIKADFEQELFELAYTVFLGNSNPREAYTVAERAVTQNPENVAWRKKAAQSAEWSGHPGFALQHWYYLSRRGDSEARTAALRLSRALQEFPLRKQLLEEMLIEGGADTAIRKEYLTVIEEMGLPQEAFNLLGSGRIRAIDPVWQLTEQARLAEQLGHPSEAINLWKKRAQLQALNTDEALKLSTLWYGLGDIAESFQALKQCADSAPANAVDFWRTYSDLAWARQDSAETTRAIRQLIAGSHAIESDYQRMVEINYLSSPDRGYEYASAGWQRFHTPYFWYMLADTGMRTGRARELVSFLENMSADDRAHLARDARSWIIMSQVYRQAGNPASSLTAARLAVRLAPDDAEMLSSYLWILVDLKQVAELRHLVRKWEVRISAIPELREPLAAAMMLLGETPRALRHYRALIPQRQKDPAWLASFGDVLEQAGDSENAWKVRLRAQALLKNKIRSATPAAEDSRAASLLQAQLLMHLATGDGLTGLIRKIAVHNRDDFGQELIMGWAMASGQTDLARYWYWKNLARAAQRPEWARLGLALEDNDQTIMADLLDSKLEQLPYRDAVEAAQRSGSTPLAQEHAFERFHINDRDHLMDKQLRDLYEQRQGRFIYSITAHDRSGIGLLEQQLLLALPYSNRIYLKGELTNTDIRHLKTGIVGDYTSSIQELQLSLGYRYPSGNATLSAGMRDGLYRYFKASTTASLRLDSKLALDAVLRTGATAEESIPLLIGGLKDELQLGANLILTGRDTLRAQSSLFVFGDQERRYLGGGSAVDIEWGHRVNVAWPDITLRQYAGYHDFTADGTPVGRTRALIPTGSPQTARYFIPESFGIAGTGIAYGLTWKDTYTREWKSFGTLDSSWNSVSGIGFHYELGIVGPLFGLDALLFSVSQESGAFGTSALSSRLDMRYRYYFR